MTDENKLLGVMESRTFRFVALEGTTAAYVDGVDVTERLRDPRVTANARYVASSSKLRARLVTMQRQFAAGHDRIVTEGRDQGTVAFADADVKFYLTADAVERARRRRTELQARGIDESLKQIQEAIQDRDRSDEGRAVGPLKPADDAIVVDTTDLDAEEVVAKVLRYVEERCSEKR